jgi:thiazole synthase
LLQGRSACEAGLMEKRDMAMASTPIFGLATLS